MADVGRLAVVGDDLTGTAALVAEATISGKEGTVTALGAPPPHAAVWGIDLASREASAAENERRLEGALGRALDWGAEHVFLKVDSRWRGQPEALLAAAQRYGPVAVFNGRLASPETAGVAWYGRDEALACLPTVRAAANAGVRLWLGGLTVALAVMHAARGSRPSVLALIGSREQACEEQIDYCAAAGVPVATLAAQNAVADVTRSLEAALAGAGIGILRSSVSEPACRDDAEAAFAAMAACVTRLPNVPSGLVISGGHTAGAVLAALGIRESAAFSFAGDPGLVLMRPAVPTWQHLGVVTKPGHFGPPRTLLYAMLALQARVQFGPDY
jgi:uncharacterized protein YgbK (DUF1537 family)